MLADILVSLKLNETAETKVGNLRKPVEDLQQLPGSSGRAGHNSSFWLDQGYGETKYGLSECISKIILSSVLHPEMAGTGR